MPSIQFLADLLGLWELSRVVLRAPHYAMPKLGRLWEQQALFPPPCWAGQLRIHAERGSRLRRRAVLKPGGLREEQDLLPRRGGLSQCGRQSERGSAQRGGSAGKPQEIASVGVRHGDHRNKTPAAYERAVGCAKGEHVCAETIVVG